MEDSSRCFDRFGAAVQGIERVRHLPAVREGEQGGGDACELLLGDVAG